MRLLFDLGHPAHVHLFRNFITYLREHGHEVTVTARDKDLTITLLDYYKIPYVSLSKSKQTRAGMLTELISRDLQIFKINQKKRFQVAFGTSVSIAHLSAISRVKSYCFADDDDDVVPLYAGLTYPFATKIINPAGLRFKRWKNKRVLHNSYQKLAYLHPNNFVPNPEVLRKYALEPKKYVLVRNSALTAHHDSKAEGLNSSLWLELQNMLGDYEIVYSKENSKRQIEPWDMHHILAFSKILISDSQSMTVEAAVLGVPNIRYNNFVGRISCLEELGNKYSLTFGYRPGQEKELKTKLRELLTTDGVENIWQQNRYQMLKDKGDFTAWLIDYFERSVAI